MGGNSMRSISEEGLDLIKSFEGYHTALADGSCKAYLDRLARPMIWTIGYGLTEGVYEGMVLTAHEAEQHLMKEISGHEKAVNRLVTVPIAQEHFDALVSFSYNVGSGALGRSTLLKKLNREDYEGAEEQFKRWNKAGGKVYRGLVRRRKAEASLFSNGTIALFVDDTESDPMWWQADADHMPQKVEEQPEMTKTKVALGVGTAAATTGATVAAQQPPGTWETMTTFATSMGGFAASSPTVVLIILGGMGALWFLPKLQAYRVSK